MPRTTLNLVSELISRVEELRDDDLDDLLSILEEGMAEVICEIQKRGDRKKVALVDLRLISNNPDD